MVKRKRLLFCLALCFTIALLPHSALANNLNGQTINELNELYGDAINFDTDSYQISTDVYIGEKYEKDSTEGFSDPYTASNGKKYIYRLRHIKLDEIDYGDITKVKHIVSVPKGSTATTSKTITNSTTYTTSWSTSVELSTSFSILQQSIDSTVSSTYTSEREETESITISSGRTYSYPSDAPAGYNIAHFYTGFIHDKYEVVTDIVEYTAMEKQTKFINHLPHPRHPDIFTIFVLEDGREITLRNDQIDDYISGGYYIETVYGYDYDNMESHYGTILSPKPITFILYGEI